MIAGNLLKRALRLVKAQPVTYRRFAGRTTNGIGLDVSEYECSKQIVGSVQAVPRSAYEQLGLDFQKQYVTLYTETEVLDLRRDISGDLIEFYGKTYQLVSSTDWQPMDGWQSVLCVEVPNAR